MKQKTKNIRLHQGDCIGFSTTLPAGAIKVSNRPIALGGVSGHAHCITGDVELFEFEGRTFACVGSEGARLQHIHESSLTDKAWTSSEELPVADHGSHLLAPGVYEMVIQNSYNPYTKLMEKVID